MRLGQEPCWAWLANPSLPRGKNKVTGWPSAGCVPRIAPIACRAERRVLTISRAESVSPEVVKDLNRLSDLLLVLARGMSEAPTRCADTIGEDDLKLVYD